VVRACAQHTAPVRALRCSIPSHPSFVPREEDYSYCPSTRVSCGASPTGQPSQQRARIATDGIRQSWNHRKTRLQQRSALRSEPRGRGFGTATRWCCSALVLWRDRCLTRCRIGCRPQSGPATSQGMTLQLCIDVWTDRSHGVHPDHLGASSIDSPPMSSAPRPGSRFGSHSIAAKSVRISLLTHNYVESSQRHCYHILPRSAAPRRAAPLTCSAIETISKAPRVCTTQKKIEVGNDFA
jgi:hypothetical protein